MCGTFSAQHVCQSPSQPTIKWNQGRIIPMLAKYILAATFIAATTVLTVIPAQATTGRDAVGLCIDRPGCKWRVNKSGSIDIFPPGGGIIYCPSATAECIPFRKKGADQVRGSAGGTASQ
jgi:hypothetical protein